MSPTTDLPQAEPDPAPAPSEQTVSSAAPAPRSILAFLGGQSKPNPLALNPNPAKRVRRNPEPAASSVTQTQTQGRIVLKPSNGSAWSVEKSQVEENAGPSVGTNGKARGKGKGKSGGGEEDEMREMGKRAKAAQRGRGGKRASAGKRNAPDKGVKQQLDLKASQDEEEDNGTEDGEDPLLLAGDKGTRPHTIPSPRKKRGRQTTQKAPANTARSTSTSRSTSPPVAYIRSSSPNDVIVTGTNGSSNGTSTVRRKQPALSRANTNSTNDLRGGSQKDAIDVEQVTAPVKAGPKKLVFASDAKPAHSFFSRKPDVVTAPTTPEVEPSSLPSEPTEPLASMFVQPVAVPKPLPAAVPPKKVHNFFQPPRDNGKSSAIKKGWGHGVKEGVEWLPPWPGSEWPVSTGVDNPSCEAGPSCLRRRSPPVPTYEPDVGFWPSVLKQAEIHNQNALSAAEIRKRKRPNRMYTAKISDRETLCDQFRPRKASQVLGNANEATYLRDWLSALGVGARNGSGPKVVRGVPKRKHKLDDWIVDDIGTFDNAPEEAEGEAPEPYEEPFLELGQRPAAYAPLSAWLTNTILLSGPSGSGKSAAVYAAASELGWEVFEVYPGIGKRTGGNLMSLVGDVGKNHMVNKGRDQEGIKPSPVPLKPFFESAPIPVKVDVESGPPMGSQGEPIEVDDEPHPVREVAPPPRLRDPSLPSTPFRDDVKFRQSLILLEEVDILFDEEATFWPAVISLIAESKRPVVMTCSDPERVMLDALPLQAILFFQPPPRDLAITHLDSICEKLGIERDAGYTAELYDRCVVRPPHILEAPGPPNGNEWLPSFDLRRATMQLQLERGHPVEDSTSASQRDLEDLDTAMKRADLISYNDAHIGERSWAMMEMTELDRYQPTPDDQLGIKILLKAELADRIPNLPAYDHTFEISQSLLDGVGGTPTSGDLFTDQIHYIRSLLPLLDPIIPLSSRLLPHPTLFTEFMPAIQNLVRIDDFNKIAYEAAKENGDDLRNFKTGRPVRVTSWLNQDYIRGLVLEPDALEIARRELVY